MNKRWTILKMGTVLVSVLLAGTATAAPLQQGENLLQNPGFDWFPQWHYAVVIGYDIASNEIILRSGTTRRWIASFEVFERSWQRADYWALVIVPVDSIPATAKPLPYLKTAYAFEETGKTDIALQAYLSASKRWPDEAITWMALGNMAFAAHDLAGAVSAFSVATRLAPDSIASWNNLAYALHAAGCGEQAQTAIQCGLKVAPDNSNLHDTGNELLNNPVNSRQLDCPLIQFN